MTNDPKTPQKPAGDAESYFATPPPQKYLSVNQSSPSKTEQGHQTVTVRASPEKITPQTPRNVVGLILGMRKPVLIVVVIVGVSLAGYGIYGWYENFTLSTQADELELKVDNLQKEIKQLKLQVDNFGIENDRYESLNDELNGTIGDFEVVASDLNSTSKVLRNITYDLNETNHNLLVEVDKLGEINSQLRSTYEQLRDDSLQLNDTNNKLTDRSNELRDLSMDLNLTAIQLEENADQLNETNQGLEIEVAELEKITSEFNTTATLLVELNVNLTLNTNLLVQDIQNFSLIANDLTTENNLIRNTTYSLKQLKEQLTNITLDKNIVLADLNETLANFTIQNTRLEQLNDDLVEKTAVLSSLLSNDTALTVVTNELADLIEDFDALSLAKTFHAVEERKQFNYEQIMLWDCDYVNLFYKWAKDFTLPISDFDAVVSFLEEREFYEDLCLNTTNFLEFLDAKYPMVDRGVNMTSHLLFKGVDNYVSEALVHFYPKADECGLTFDEQVTWGANGHSCDSLANKFLWNAAGPDLSCQ